MSEPLGVQEFRATVSSIAERVSSCAGPVRLTIMGYDVDGVEIVIACAGDEGVVLSVGDTRVSLTKPQLDVLKVLLDTFEYKEKT